MNFAALSLCGCMATQAGNWGIVSLVVCVHMHACIHKKTWQLTFGNVSAGAGCGAYCRWLVWWWWQAGVSVEWAGAGMYWGYCDVCRTFRMAEVVVNEWMCHPCVECYVNTQQTQTRNTQQTQTRAPPYIGSSSSRSSHNMKVTAAVLDRMHIPIMYTFIYTYCICIYVILYVHVYIILYI